jgi:hypothetical protein
MATEVRESNNTAVWVVLGLLALVAIIAIAWMATAGGRADLAENEPSTVIADIRDTTNDGASAAARSAENAAERAADAADRTARNANDAAADATGRVTANIPAGDANIRVDAPVR